MELNFKIYALNGKIPSSLITPVYVGSHEKCPFFEKQTSLKRKLDTIGSPQQNVWLSSWLTCNEAYQLASSAL